VVCELSKHTRTSYISRMHRTSSIFDLIHSDVWGPSPVMAFSGHRYYVTFIDDHSRCTWVYLLKKKSDVLPLFTQFLQMIKTQFNIVVRAIRSDNGGEYISDGFCSQLNQKGVLQQLSCHYTPEQNGVAERKKPSYHVYCSMSSFWYACTQVVLAYGCSHCSLSNKPHS
jgi:transposase InsO family protein